MKDNAAANSVLDRYTNRVANSEPATAEAEAADDLGAFGWLRGVRDRAIMLELRHKDGKVTAFGYAWLERAEFDPSDGITLHFAGKEVRITGRNLNADNQPNIRLFNGILRHRVPWVQEADGAEVMSFDSKSTIIEALIVT
jgi:hypothetical protein